MSFAGALLAGVIPCAGQVGSQWRVYRAVDGLPESFAASVNIGRRGHLWVRHPYVEWAAWLDGYDVKAIPVSGLGTSRIYESASGQLWTCTLEGLHLYKDKDAGWSNYKMPELAAAFRNTTPNFYRPVPICPVRQNHVLALLPTSLLECSIDASNHLQTTVLRNAADTGLQKFFGIILTPDGGLWISGAKGLAKISTQIRYIKPDTIWEEHLVPAQLELRNFREPILDANGGVTCVAESLDGNRQMAVHFDGKQWSPIAPGEKLLMAWHGVDNSWWAATPTALLRFRSDKKKFEPDESVPARRIVDAAVETNGVFWLATSDGLFRHAPLCWRVPADAPVESPIAAMIEDREEQLWAVMANGLAMLHNERWTNFVFPTEIATNLHEIRSVFALASGVVVMESDNRLIEFDPANANFHFVNAPQNKAARLLGFLKDGSLCVQLMSAGIDDSAASQLAVFDGEAFRPFPYPQPEFTPGNELQSLVTDPAGVLWLGGRKGILRFADQKWQLFMPGKAQSSTAISAITDVGNGKVWCGIDDKVWQFDGNSWTLLKAGLEHVNGFLKSSDGSIWIASDNALHRFNRGTWTANGVEEGLPSASIRTVLQDRRGHLWAATTRGLSEYHPEADPDPPRTYVQNLPERNNTVRQGSIVTVSFNGQDRWKYTSDDRLLYSYRLDGQDWSSYQEQRNATFLDLPAGKHSFYVRSMDRNWNVDPKPAMLDFVVALPWYLETRLLLISALGLGGVLFFAGVAFNRHRRLVRSYAEVEAKVALRTKQLELANQELFHSQKMNALGTLAAGIAHDFNNILSIIKGSAQIIETNLDDQEKIRTRTDRIKTVVEQGAGIVKAMLGFSRVSDNQPAACDVNGIIAETIQLLGDRFLHEIDVQFHPAPKLPQVPASKDFVQQILLNFIFNAAEASTERRQVILTAKESAQLPQTLALKPAAAGSYVMVSVQDFGTGIAPEIMPRIFEPFFTTKAFSTRRGTGLGLSMAYELARQMDCGLSVESAPGKGSVFTLILPVRDLPMDEPKKSDKIA